MTRPLTANPSTLRVDIRGGYWRDQAACLGEDPELFFLTGDESGPDQRADIAAAKSVCRRCPVKEECLQAALDSDDRHAIAGGLTPRQRRYRGGKRAAA